MPNSQIQLSFQVCPIYLTGGSVANIPGGILPMQALFTGGDGTGLTYDPTKLDDSFGSFNVLPGGTLISQSIGKYPFANQYVAANAVIEEPLSISVIMDAPMRGPNAFQKKMSVMTALKATLNNHNVAGGTYTVATPAYMYENLIMLSLTDNSRGNNTLPQNAWRFDFEKPLVVLTDLQGAQSQTMQKFTNQVPTTGNTSGPSPGVTSAQSNLTGTIKTQAGIMGGTPPTLMNRSTAMVENYPALPRNAGLPYSGIS